MLLAECWLRNKRYYFPFYGFEFIERLWAEAYLVDSLKTTEQKQIFQFLTLSMPIPVLILSVQCYSACSIWKVCSDHQSEGGGWLKFARSGLLCDVTLKKSKKPVSKKKKNSGAHYQQIWEILESRIDGQGERFTHSKHCR